LKFLLSCISCLINNHPFFALKDGEKAAVKEIMLPYKKYFVTIANPNKKNNVLTAVKKQTGRGVIQYKNLYAVPKESFDAFVKHKAGSFPNVKSLKVNQLNFNDAKQIKPQHMGANAFTKSGKTISVVNTGENESRLSAPGSLNDTSTGGV